uniref:Integrase zinc-binding domain-containing protein n=1 Tax=Timema shepardi TaxID=629360 RepID=A0A7R9FYA5_TIMSH|nr:unnamed protein product [Timema shepardi]
MRASEPALAWKKSGKPFRKNHPISPKRDLNLNLPVLGSLAQHETSELGDYTTEMFGFPLNMSYTNMEAVTEAMRATGVHYNENPGVEFALAVPCYSSLRLRVVTGCVYSKCSLRVTFVDRHRSRGSSGWGSSISGLCRSGGCRSFRGIAVDKDKQIGRVEKYKERVTATQGSRWAVGWGPDNVSRGGRVPTVDIKSSAILRANSEINDLDRQPRRGSATIGTHWVNEDAVSRIQRRRYKLTAVHHQLQRRPVEHYKIRIAHHDSSPSHYSLLPLLHIRTTHRDSSPSTSSPYSCFARFISDSRTTYLSHLSHLSHPKKPYSPLSLPPVSPLFFTPPRQRRPHDSFQNPDRLSPLSSPRPSYNLQPTNTPPDPTNSLPHHYHILAIRTLESNAWNGQIYFWPRKHRGLSPSYVDIKEWVPQLLLHVNNRGDDKFWRPTSEPTTPLVEGPTFFGLPRDDAPRFSTLPGADEARDTTWLEYTCTACRSQPPPPPCTADNCPREVGWVPIVRRQLNLEASHWWEQFVEFVTTWEQFKIRLNARLLPAVSPDEAIPLLIELIKPGIRSFLHAPPPSNIEELVDRATAIEKDHLKQPAPPLSLRINRNSPHLGATTFLSITSIGTTPRTRKRPSEKRSIEMELCPTPNGSGRTMGSNSHLCDQPQLLHPSAYNPSRNYVWPLLALVDTAASANFLLANYLPTKDRTPISPLPYSTRPNDETPPITLADVQNDAPSSHADKLMNVLKAQRPLRGTRSATHSITLKNTERIFSKLYRNFTTQYAIVKNQDTMGDPHRTLDLRDVQFVNTCQLKNGHILRRITISSPWRLLVPHDLQLRVLYQYYDHALAGHPGEDETHRAISQDYTWAAPLHIYENHRKWDLLLPQILFHLRCRRNEASDMTPNQLLFGHTLRRLGEWRFPDHQGQDALGEQRGGSHP